MIFDGTGGYSRDSLSVRSEVVVQIADYVERARKEPAVDRARDAAVRAIFDLLGAAAVGIGEVGPLAIRTTLQHTKGLGTVPIWFTGETATVVGAAWANSAAASALDIDDGHRLARGHPGAAVIPTALAVAYETGASLEETISAIVIGYEVGVTIAAARETYGNTGTWAPYAVVATAGALRRTTPSVLAQALAIAGQSAPNQLFSSAPNLGEYAPEGNAVKEGIPWSVVTGLTALDLARAGHTGPRNILDSPMHFRFPNDLRLGSSPHICNTYFKIYACCRHVHAPLDALLQVLNSHSISPEDIDAIDVETTSGALRITNRAKPANLIDIQFSIPYCLALAATRGPDVLLPPTADLLEDHEAITLARKVRLSLNPEFDSRFPAETLARVTVMCGDHRFISDVVTPKGEATAPLSWTDLVTKFVALTRIPLSPEQQEQILKAIEDLPDGDMSTLTAVLSQINVEANV